MAQLYGPGECDVSHCWLVPGSNGPGLGIAICGHWLNPLPAAFLQQSWSEKVLATGDSTHAVPLPREADTLQRSLQVLAWAALSVERASLTFKGLVMGDSTSLAE